MQPNNSNQQEEIKKWMEDIAKQNQPKKKLIFDKVTKKLIAVPLTDPKADQNLEFTPDEAKRF